jgi:hypothetical protein
MLLHRLLRLTFPAGALVSAHFDPVWSSQVALSKLLVASDIVAHAF